MKANWSLSAPKRELPDPFVGPDGARITDPAQWPRLAAYWKEHLAEHLYGVMPPSPGNTRGDVFTRQRCYGGKALRERVQITCGPGRSIRFFVDVVRPNRPGRFPVFVWNDFAHRWPCPVEEEAVVRRGYAIANFNREEIARDREDFADCAAYRAYPGYSWRAIALWAWGQNRVVDYLEKTCWADPDRLISTGHSRGGKVALCAAIYDARYALCAPNASGCGGAGSYRFLGGRLGEGVGECESLGEMCKRDRFWYWLTDEAAAFGDTERFAALGEEALLPYDGHIVRALIAPRPIITTEGLDDTWSNTFGTQVSWRAAEEVYRFLGAAGKNALHYREGGHAYNAEDWSVVLDFADNMLFGADKDSTYKTVAAGEDPLAPGLHMPWRAPRG